MNNSNRLQLAMKSGNGFSIQVAETEEEVLKEINDAVNAGRRARFKGVDEAETVLLVQPKEIEGFLIMPERPRSELAIPRRPGIQ